MALYLTLAAVDTTFAQQAHDWVMFVVNVLIVLVGLGLVIFVHELGHFTVAKLCGVKCEKFYLGFDIFGLRIWRVRWGETEYGIGALPLGGYVKMLGQEDNPARLREELERAKQLKAAPATSVEEVAKNVADGEPPIDIRAAEEALYNPRSYLAQSVPRRMAIISAGVIMNVIFAYLVAMIAFGMGVEQIPAEVGAVSPGEAAWQAGIQVGDRVTAVAGQPVTRFADLQRLISLGDVESGVAVTIDRPGVGPIEMHLTPSTNGLAPMIGVGNISLTTLAQEVPVMPGSVAAKVKPGFQGGDRVVAVDDKPVDTFAQMFRILAAKQDETIQVTVERTGPADKSNPQAAPRTERVTIAVPPVPMKRLGLEMGIGEVTAVQQDSPAAKKGVQPGDVIVRIGPEPAGDPATLPDRVRRLGESIGQVDVVVRRQNKDVTLTDVPLRPVDRFETPLSRSSSMSLPTLGIAYGVTNEVRGIVPDSPAAKTSLKSGDMITSATILPPEEQPPEAKQRKVELDFAPGKDTWPLLLEALQQALPGSLVKLERPGDTPITLDPVAAPEWTDPRRGFRFEAKTFLMKASSPGEAVAMGSTEATNSLMMVVRFLRKLGTQVSPKAISGPVGIAHLAYQIASQGLGEFLLFITMISANLAVVNFLPIPVLDGGHMVFLAYEGLRGKPPSERLQVGLSYVGLLLLLTLMLYASGLDLHLISRN